MASTVVEEENPLQTLSPHSVDLQALLEANSMQMTSLNPTSETEEEPLPHWPLCSSAGSRWKGFRCYPRAHDSKHLPGQDFQTQNWESMAALQCVVDGQVKLYKHLALSLPTEFFFHCSSPSPGCCFVQSLRLKLYISKASV